MMKVFLLHPEQDFDASQPLPPMAEDLMQDLALNVLLEAMAKGDEFLFRTLRQVLLSSLQDMAVIQYRQEVLQDCLNHPDVIRRIYRIPLEFMERKRRQWLWISTRYSPPASILNSAQQMLAATLDLLWELRRIADAHAEQFTSRGFRRFFAMIQQELDDPYLALVERQVNALRFPQGVLLSARLGAGNEGAEYVLRKPNNADQPWIKRMLTRKSPTYSYTLHPRDEAGARILGELRDRGVARAANAVAQAADHIESFFKMLQFELAFYIGCLNLYEELKRLAAPITFPRPAPLRERRLTCTNLHDVTLLLTMQQAVVGNSIAADGKDLIVITGPNRGGKTTFLRSVGAAQLMMQCGMFVPAASFSANLCTGLFTHFKRAEDKTLESGKFQEELQRMSAIVAHLTPNALLLCNESFASTNEREGSEIARQIVSALLEKRVKVAYVTHMYELAHHFWEHKCANALFLRAERLPDGTRTFRLQEGEPLETSYGVDVYRRIFGEDNEPLQQESEFARYSGSLQGQQ
ncbi:MAG: DNA mismatch repair protein MutS [Caldilinea sp.]|nr:DNA mismatch repair protein MutS [Caldilinea sp.]MDW8442356.1 DNA mismatch repair protein MutS [Caldilineaceae bacterium]